MATQLELPLDNPNAISLSDILAFVAGIPAAIERSAIGQAIIALIEWLGELTDGIRQRFAIAV